MITLLILLLLKTSTAHAVFKQLAYTYPVSESKKYVVLTSYDDQNFVGFITQAYEMVGVRFNLLYDRISQTESEALLHQASAELEMRRLDLDRRQNEIALQLNTFHKRPRPRDNRHLSYIDLTYGNSPLASSVNTVDLTNQVDSPLSPFNPDFSHYDQPSTPYPYPNYQRGMR